MQHLKVSIKCTRVNSITTVFKVIIIMLVFIHSWIYDFCVLQATPYFIGLILLEVVLGWLKTDGPRIKINDFITSLSAGMMSRLPQWVDNNFPSVRFTSQHLQMTVVMNHSKVLTCLRLQNSILLIVILYIRYHLSLQRDWEVFWVLNEIENKTYVNACFSRAVIDFMTCLSADELCSCDNSALYVSFSRLMVRSLELSAYIYVWNNFRLLELPWDSAWTWWLAFFGVDMGYYWFHRFAHGMWISCQMHCYYIRPSALKEFAECKNGTS